VAREFHTLKGLAATLGADALSRAAAEAERAFAAERPTGDAVQALQALPAMLAAMAAAEAALSSLGEALDGGPAAGQPAALQPALQPSLQPAVIAAAPLGAGTASTAHAAALPALTDLLRLLAQSDLSAVDAVQRLRAEHAELAGPRLEALVEAVDDLNFDTALTQCDEWITLCKTP
jgi:HPt (histidine-containing phosphotransfer) domain-containing protein